MLALILACSINISGLRAQVAYNFQTPDDVPLWTGGYTPYGVYDWLTMDCIAANGYGQWTSTSSPENENGEPSCFLLPNLLTNSTYATDEVQGSVLGSSVFAYSGYDDYPGYGGPPNNDAVKAAANLKGSVRYVWFGTTERNQFYAEGFNAGSSIDISFSLNNSIIQSDLTMGAHNPYILSFGHTFVNSTNEENGLDRFDCAMDATYLYVVWEEKVSGYYSAWVEVIKLSDGSIALGPTPVTPNSGPGSAGSRRPTISVDVRHSGSIAPFDVVYLDPTIPSNTGNVWWTQYNTGTGFSTPAPLSTLYNDPLHGFSTWEAPRHARILTASEATLTPTASNQRAVYIIAGTSCDGSGYSCYTHLFLDYIKDGFPAPPSEYCDGTSNNSRPSGCPVESGSSSFFPVVDNPIWAFANPYEGANAGGESDFTEFHCLYQLARTDGISTPTSNNPLMIIPGSHVTSGFCVNGSGPATFYDDPVASGLNFDGYCGAVNQMGIHIHWIGATEGDHFYRRDLREFDQNIEENTLLTGQCDVGNTESGVGTSSPTVLQNLDITFYSEPSSDPTPTDYLWTSSLDFDNAATLNIGSSTDAGSDFVLVGTAANPMIWGQAPTCPTCSTNTWTVTFGADNTLDYYAAQVNSMYVPGYGSYGNGNPLFYGNGQFTLTGTGETLTANGTESGNYVSNIAHPAKWKIHTEKEFDLYPYVPNDPLNTINVTATDAIFDFDHDNFRDGDGIEPGYLCTFGNGTYTNCEFNIDLSSFFDDYCMNVFGYGTWDGTTGKGDGNYDATHYLSAQNHNVTFTSCHAQVGIEVNGCEINHPLPPDYINISPPAVTVSGGLFEYVGIDVGNWGLFAPANNVCSPWWPISITDATFDYMNTGGAGISVELGFPTIDLGSIAKQYQITIDHNEFKTFGSTLSCEGNGYEVLCLPAAIYVADAPDVALSDALREAITVTNNNFEGAGSEEPGSIVAAIHFDNVTGDIGLNTIGTSANPAVKYQHGIWNESSQLPASYVYSGFTSQPTWSLICSNSIYGLTHSGAAGLSTDWYTGFAKLDTISDCYFGQLSGFKDKGYVLFSGYTNNLNAAYEGTNTGQTDMSGDHTPGAELPGYNIFKNNNSGGSQIILLGDGAKVRLGAGIGTPTWTVWGDNDIEGSTDVFETDIYVPDNIGDVSNNYWGGGSFSEANVTYSAGTGLGSSVISRAFYCSDGLGGDIAGKGKGKSILSIEPLDTGMSHCDSLYYIGYDDLEFYHLFEQSYDTLKLFMEECPFYPNSDEGFNDILSAVDGWQADGAGRWPDFLSWLKKVLYYNPDTLWYCEDVSDMVSALEEQPNDAAAASAVQYVLTSNRCPDLGFEQLYINAKAGMHGAWIDSIKVKYAQPQYKMQYYNDSVNADTLAHPFDSTPPSLYAVDLQILMGLQFAAVQTSQPITSEALLDAQLLENPMKSEIDISFDMGRTAMVSMQLSDLLGRNIPIANAKYQLEQPGQHDASIPIPNLPSGNYYLRITTDTGDAITLKVVKE